VRRRARGKVRARVHRHVDKHMDANETDRSDPHAISRALNHVLLPFEYYFLIIHSSHIIHISGALFSLSHLLSTLGKIISPTHHTSSQVGPAGVVHLEDECLLLVHCLAHHRPRA